MNVMTKPWIFRTYSGYSTAAVSNALYKKNLAKGQTGLSVAFDLPTQTGFDSDHPFARPEVGKVGVPVCSLADMQALFDDIPLANMNTSMTINATAPWLLSLYITVAKQQGADISSLRGTTQNDIFKEYLSRGTYIYPPQASLRLTTDLILYTTQHLPKWNPINVCPYHLQEAGATPVQELAFGLANAICLLDAVKASGEVAGKDFERVVGRISFFLDSGIRFIEEMCKTRAFTKLWDQITRDRYGVEDPKNRRFRYGVQVNSLGLTEAQPENNVIRIVLEALGVTLSEFSRARALQLPAWNESLGLPRPWDQQWSLRIQQILAYETDLLEYGDLFEGSTVVELKTEKLMEEALSEIQKIEEQGGAIAAIENGYLKSQLIGSQGSRLRAIEEGTQKVVGVNCFQETESSPLAGDELNFVKVDEDAVGKHIESLQAFRKARDAGKAQEALAFLKECATGSTNIMEASLACAESGVTTGEWANTLRDVFGTYQAPTGVSTFEMRSQTDSVTALRGEVQKLESQLGGKIRFLVAKPGLDGHSNGAEQIALKARDVGMEVIYQGIRQSPEEVVECALQEDVTLIGISILSGSHLEVVPQILELLKARDVAHIPVIVGGIVSDADAAALREQGVKRVFTPKDYDLNKIFDEILTLLGKGKA